MAGRRDWVDVDMDGLRKVLERRGKELALYELVQNAWDENVTKVEVTLTRPVNGRSELVVTDDSPEGFRDLTDSYTMFAESYKKADPEKRGAFNLGEKYVLALCDEAAITTTTGRVTFDGNGRRRTGSVNRERGSEFRGSMRLKVSEWEQVCAAVTKLIPPVPTFFNGTEIATRKPFRTWKATLPTVKSDEEGNLRQTNRNTTISLYAVERDETPILYEMGIPVVDFECKYHVSVGQKVPLNIDRDNVQPSFASRVLVEVLNQTADKLSEQEATDNWVTTGASDPRCKVIKTVMDKRFGEDRYSFNPNDPESNKIAISEGSMIIHGSVLPGGMWENARRDGAIAPPPPSPKAHFSAYGKEPISREKWTEGMKTFEEFVRHFGEVVLGRPVGTIIYADCGGGQNWSACFTEGGPDLKVAKRQCGGNRFFDGGAEAHHHEWVELLIHEFSHDKVSDHLSSEFHEECCRIGATYAEHLRRELAAACRDGRTTGEDSAVREARA